MFISKWLNEYLNPNHPDYPKRIERLNQAYQDFEDSIRRDIEARQKLIGMLDEILTASKEKITGNNNRE